MRNWLDTTRQTLFCHGLPGVGKTIITSSVINYLQTNIQERSRQNREGSFGVGFVYCDFQQRAQQKAVDILASLLKQLIQKLSAVPEIVRSLYKEHKNNTSSSCPIGDIAKALQSAVSSYARVFIVIDALDECEDRSKLLTEISKIQVQTQANLFTTSRPIQEIKIEFEKLFEGNTSFEIRATDEDLKKYIDGRTLDLVVLRGENRELKEEIRIKIKDRVTEAVNGM